MSLTRTTASAVLSAQVTGTAPISTSDAAGVITITAAMATEAEVLAGTETAKLVSPATNQAARTADLATVTGLLGAKANLNSPTFSGSPRAPTATAADSSTLIATTAFVTTADNLKANLASPTFTGTPAAPTASPGTNTTQLATTAFVAAADALKANLASPTFTGVPAAPTAAAGTNTTQIATTAFVASMSRFLHSYRTAQRHTGSTAKTELYRWTLPAGTMGLNSMLRILSTWDGTGTAGTKTTAIEFGGTAFFQTPVSAANISNGNVVTTIANLGSLSSQIGGAAVTAGAGSGSSAGALPTGTVDTSAAVDIVFYVTLANSGDNFGLREVLIELIPI